MSDLTSKINTRSSIIVSDVIFNNGVVKNHKDQKVQYDALCYIISNKGRKYPVGIIRNGNHWYCDLVIIEMDNGVSQTNGNTFSHIDVVAPTAETAVWEYNKNQEVVKNEISASIIHTVDFFTLEYICQFKKETLTA